VNALSPTTHLPASRATASLLLNGISVAVLYFVLGQLGLLLAISPGYATAIFPAAGLALASLMIYGIKIWPAICLGSTSLNLWISIKNGTSLDWGVLTMAIIIGFCAC